jgi:hypothetical protein
MGDEGRAMTGSAPKAGEVYFEMTTVGSSVRVAAIDAATGIEVVAIGPASASTAQLQALGLAKLKARLARDAG